LGHYSGVNFSNYRNFREKFLTKECIGFVKLDSHLNLGIELCTETLLLYYKRIIPQIIEHSITLYEADAAVALPLLYHLFNKDKKSVVSFKLAKTNSNR
jgi:hypothetical protein